jgi:WD repeat-containing protein 42A
MSLNIKYLVISVKGVNFYGPECEFIVSGSDCGTIFFWDKEGEDIVHVVVEGDVNGVVSFLMSFFTKIMLKN